MENIAFSDVSRTQTVGNDLKGTTFGPQGKTTIGLTMQVI